MAARILFDLWLLEGFPKFQAQLDKVLIFVETVEAMIFLVAVRKL